MSVMINKVLYDCWHHHVVVVVVVVCIHFLQFVRECMPFGPASKYPCATRIYWILGWTRRALQSTTNCRYIDKRQTSYDNNMSPNKHAIIFTFHWVGDDQDEIKVCTIVDIIVKSSLFAFAFYKLFENACMPFKIPLCNNNILDIGPGPKGLAVDNKLSLHRQTTNVVWQQHVAKQLLFTESVMIKMK